jgi:hypothetical protein
MTPETFVAAFPEFSEVNTEHPGLVASKIAEAQLLVSASVAGDLYTLLVRYQTAHLIATSPQGQQARLASDAGSSTYLATYTRLALTVPTGPSYG